MIDEADERVGQPGWHIESLHLFRVMDMDVNAEDNRSVVREILQRDDLGDEALLELLDKAIAARVAFVWLVNDIKMALKLRKKSV